MSTTTHSSMSALYVQLKDGVPGAREQLVGRMQDRLARLTASVLKKYPRVQRQREVDDVLNDLNVRMLRAIDAGVHPDGSTAFMGLAVCNLHRLLKDEIRRLDKPAAHAIPIGPEDSQAMGLDPGTDTYDPQQLILWAEFWGHVNLLPELERAVFVMHYVMQVKQKEIAEELGLEEKQTSRLWLKATMRLKPHLPVDGWPAA